MSAPMVRRPISHHSRRLFIFLMVGRSASVERHPKADGRVFEQCNQTRCRCDWKARACPARMHYHRAAFELGLSL